MKQHVKNKPIKWGFNFWYCIVLKMTEPLKNSHCMVFLFFNNPSLIVKLYDTGLYCIVAA